MKYIFSCLFFVFTLFTTPSYADDGINVSDAWARPTANATSPGGVYLTLTNTSDHTVVLTGVRSDRANMAHIHATIKTDGIMSMSMLEALEIKAGETVKLAPGGMHIMLMGLEKKLTKGDVFDMTFSFEKRADIVVFVEVTGMTGPK